jgi:hypothetical protein
MTSATSDVRPSLRDRLLPPNHALVVAVKVVVLLAIPVGIAAWAAGVDAAVVCALVLVITIAQAVVTRGGTQSWFVLLTAAVVVAGSLISRESIGIAIFVALVALLTYFGNRASAGLLSLLPVLAILLGLDIVSVSALTGGIVAILAGAYGIIAVRLTRLRLPRAPVSAPIAIRHAVVLATLSGVITYCVAQYKWPYGYWVVVTLAIVLRPSVRESSKLVRDRVIGTVVGSIVAVAIGAFLPSQLVWVVIAIAAWLQIANTLAQRTVAATVGTSVLVILAVAPAVSHGVLIAAGERLGWTLFGAVLAVGAGFFMSDRSAAATAS